jgi:ATP-dependent helicase YprA (DUF1998 family)
LCSELELGEAVLQSLLVAIKGAQSDSLRTWAHQEEAIRSILAGHSTVIATGTGSGKTEAFMIPVLHLCLRGSLQGKKGVKAVLVYPRNALVGDLRKPHPPDGRVMRPASSRIRPRE